MRLSADRYALSMPLFARLSNERCWGLDHRTICGDRLWGSGCSLIKCQVARLPCLRSQETMVECSGEMRSVEFDGLVSSLLDGAIRLSFCLSVELLRSPSSPNGRRIRNTMLLVDTRDVQPGGAHDISLLQPSVYLCGFGRNLQRERCCCCGRVL